MQKHNKVWSRLSVIYLQNAADILMSVSLNQDDYKFLKQLSDEITSSSLNILLWGKLSFDDDLEDEDVDIRNISLKSAIDSFHTLWEKVYQIVRVFESNDTTSFNKTAAMESEITENPSVRLSLKMLSYFNYLCVFVSNFEQNKVESSLNASKAANIFAFKQIFQSIGKIFNFCCILYQNYQTKFDGIFLQTVDTICTYADIGVGQPFDNVANKTALFWQDVVYKNLIGRREPVFSQDRGIHKIPNWHSCVFCSMLACN